MANQFNGNRGSQHRPQRNNRHSPQNRGPGYVPVLSDVDIDEAARGIQRVIRMEALSRYAPHNATDKTSQRLRWTSAQLYTVLKETVQDLFTAWDTRPTVEEIAAHNSALPPAAPSQGEYADLRPNHDEERDFQEQPDVFPTPEPAPSTSTTAPVQDLPQPDPAPEAPTPPSDDSALPSGDSDFT